MISGVLFFYNTNTFTNLFKFIIFLFGGGELVLGGARYGWLLILEKWGR